jgi:hypothetical protein
MYDKLRIELIEKTLADLRNRIEERFPDSGLGRVSTELVGIAQETGRVLDQIRQPRVLVRIGIGLALTVIAALVVGLLFLVRPAPGAFDDDLGALLQTVESAGQDLIFFSIAVYFLLTLESRLDRRQSLHSLRRLRSIVHIVDMHQLTKDPEHLLSPGQRTPSSPEQRFTRFELARYLDYCTELLSISSKLAALHAQHLDDPVVLKAVSDIEGLASSLSNKVWQKIVILDTLLPTSS